MSIPKNHHYITQAHIRNFFNKEDKCIYLYDKKSKRFFTKNTSKSIFSEKNLNTKRNAIGDYDFSSIETELSQYFENDFPTHFDTIRQYIEEKNLTNEVNNSLLSIASYGLIAELRTPRHKKHVDNTLYNGMKDIMSIATDELREGFERAFSFNEEVKYTNTINYKDFANKVLGAMGDLIFSIEIPKNKEDFYILSDFGAATTRERINDYFNPDAKDIAYIGLPLSSKIYIHFFSSKLKFFPRPPGIHYITSEQVYLLNKANFDYTNQFIACENTEYIKNFIQDAFLI